MNKRLKGKFSIHAEDLACAGISIILGTLASPLSYTLAFLYVSYSYMRTIREAMISVFFILLCSLTVQLCAWLCLLLCDYSYG